MTDYPRIPQQLNIADLTLDRHVREGRGDRIAMRFGEESFTYAELQRCVNACGNALRDIGIGRGDRFILRSDNRPEYIFAFLAGMKIGSVPIPTASLFGRWELEHILNNSGAKAALTTGALMEPVLALREHCPSVERVIALDNAAEGGALPYGEWVAGQSDELRAAETGSDERAFIIYTSGTTGEAKGVEHAHRWIIATGDAISHVLMQLGPDDLTFSPIEISFIYALGCNCLYPLYAGAAISMTGGRFDPARTVAAMEKLRPTILIAVPTLFRRLFALGDELDAHDLGSLRLGMSSGEPLPEDTLRQARERLGIEIYDCMGQTEIHIFMHPDPKRKFGSLGLPLEGHIVKILDDEGQEAEDGVIGHVVLRADDPGLCLGYRDRPEAWSGKIKDGWYYTKDLAHRDEDGFLWYAARSDDLIKSRAYLISPREVESALMDHPAVLEAGVIGVPDDMIGQRVRAYVILRAGHDASDELAAELTEWVRDRIAHFKVPKDLLFVASLPRTATGKLRRTELRESALAERDAGPDPAS